MATTAFLEVGYKEVDEEKVIDDFFWAKRIAKSRAA